MLKAEFKKKKNLSGISCFHLINLLLLLVDIEYSSLRSNIPAEVLSICYCWEPSRKRL